LKWEKDDGLKAQEDSYKNDGREGGGGKTGRIKTNSRQKGGRKVCEGK
jgi:hypothetical protein